MQDLAEHLTAEVDHNEGFKVSSPETALWAVRKIAQKEKKISEINKLGASEIEKIMAWAERETSSFKADIAFFKGLIEPWFREYAAQEKIKTLDFPDGSLKIRAQQPEFVRNEEKLLEFLEASGFDEYIKVKKAPNWEEFKKIIRVVAGNVCVEETSQMVDGVDVVERPDKFEVKVSG